MASSGNFGTWNPLADYSSGTTFSNGNCTTAISQQNQYRACLGPAIPDSGKWYIEFFIDYQTSGFPSLMGVLDGTINSSLSSGNYLSNSGSFHIEPMYGKLYSESTTGTSYTGNSGSPAAVGDADAKVAIAIDRDANKLWFAVNNTWINVGSGVGDPANGNNPAVSSLEQNLSISHGIRQATGTSKVVINCGQDSTFGGLETAGGNADDNGFGDFFYAPPTGFLALTTANLPISADIDPAQTDDDYPSKLFNVVTYTGNGSTINVTGVGFKPDLVWIKMRSPHSYNNMMFDSNRGVHKSINSDRSNLEYDLTNALTSFDSDGFTYGNEPSGNDSGDSFVAWCWKVNGGTTASNTSGDINSTTQASDKTGLSIVTYTGNGSQGQSIGHGLTKAPEMVWFKNRSNSSVGGIAMDWIVALSTSTGSPFSSLSGSSQTLELNTSDALGGFYRTEGNFTPTTSTFSVPNNGNAPYWFNASSNNYVAYCWHSVEGFSKFGFYEGNGNADGPFVYTGFRPRMMFVKSIDSSDDWIVIDTARSTFNVTNAGLSWNLSNVETTSNRECDILSNGFKPRTSNTNLNKSSTTYLYGAWGDVPFKYNNTF